MECFYVVLSIFLISLCDLCGEKKMELEFDKEIDAILRKARTGVAVASAASPHIDADAIAAFAENALPDKAKLLYMEHFADCDRCRQLLSNAIRMSNEADATAASLVSEPVAVTTIPWYQKLFKTQNLAIAMGGLVLVFSAFLGYVLLQKQGQLASNKAAVSQITEPESSHGGPYLSGGDGVSNTTTNTTTTTAAANTTARTSNSAANSTTVVPGTSSNTAPGTFGHLESAPEKSAVGEEKPADTGGTAGMTAKPAPPPAPPVTMDRIATERERDEKKSDDDSLKEESKDTTLAKRKQAEDRRGLLRDAPQAASKVGPARSGPLQNQSNQANNGLSEMSVTRVVSGKKFNNRNGAWVDAAFQGQPTTNVRRGTDEYKKLDAGLRNIANSLSGAVIVVWKEKAYRIL